MKKVSKTVKATKPRGRPRKLMLTAAEVAVANKLGVSTKEYAKAKFRMVHAATSNTSIHDPVNHPAHYTDGGIEVIDFIEAKRLGYHLGNVIKYICRAGKKGTNMGMEDLRKARWYLDRAIQKNETDPVTR